MSLQLANLAARQYATTLMLLSQQKGSRLRMAVTEDMYKGEQASPVDQLGKAEMQDVDTRFEPMVRTDLDVDRRWLFPESKDIMLMVDHFDKLKMLTDPNGKYVQTGLNAFGRAVDRQILSKMLGDNKTGKDGSTTTSFPAGNVIAVDNSSSVNTGMTVAKLIAAKEILSAGDVDLASDELYCAITAKEQTTMLKEAQVISLDFNDRPVLVNGLVEKFMGINFIHTELVGATAQLSSGDHQCPVWAKSGVHLGLWEDVRVDVSQRKDIRGLPWQIYVWITMDACRLEEAKVVNIKCDF